MNYPEDRKVVVLGAGKTGAAAALFLVRRGARVRLLDDRAGPGLAETKAALEDAGVRVELGGRFSPLEPGTSLLVASPGAAADHPVIRSALARDIPVWSEIELAFRHCPAPILAVTGTNGKSTVVSLLHRMLVEDGQRALLGGNIGVPFVSMLGEAAGAEALVLEISSFQLEWVQLFRPRIAVLLNITPDHLDRYPDIEAYRAAKEQLFARQAPGDFALVNWDDPAARAAGARTPVQPIFFRRAGPGPGGSFTLDGRVIRLPSGEKLLDLPESALTGAHNEENILAAAAAACLAGARAPAIARAVAGFRPLRHRMETVAEKAGVRYIDDSKGTNLDATLRAVASFPRGTPRLVLIMGGRDKGGGYRQLVPELAGRVKGVVLIGEAAGLIESEFRGLAPLHRAAGLPEAVAAAAALAAPGDTVLLSPACSSFDMFRDYAHRGEVFRQAVEALDGKSGGNSTGGRGAGPENGGR